MVRSSSLTDSTSKGKPDIEAVDISSRIKSIDEIFDVTTKPMIFDGDTGGKPEHLEFTIRSLENWCWCNYHRRQNWSQKTLFW